MIRIILITTALAIATPGFAQSNDHHGHGDQHNHASHDQQHDEHEKAASIATESQVTLYRTTEINAAIANGGSPVVVEVLGVVCDFCATAMNKTFGRNDAVQAVYVDLDTKTLNLVLSSEDAMSDDEIQELVTHSGYKAKAVHRADYILGG